MTEYTPEGKTLVITDEYDRDNVLSDDAYRASERLMQPGFQEAVTALLKKGLVVKVDDWGHGNYFVSFITPDCLPLGVI